MSNLWLKAFLLFLIVCLLPSPFHFQQLYNPFPNSIYSQTWEIQPLLAGTPGDENGLESHTEVLDAELGFGLVCVFLCFDFIFFLLTNKRKGTCILYMYRVMDDNKINAHVTSNREGVGFHDI